MGIQLHTVPTTMQDSPTYPYIAKHISNNVYWVVGKGRGVKLSGNSDRVVGAYTDTLDTNLDVWEILPKGTSFTFTQG